MGKNTLKHTRIRNRFGGRLVGAILLGMVLSGFVWVAAGKWVVVPVPEHPTATNTQLKGVTSLGPNDAWAVGRWFDPNVKIHAMHWNGSAWNFVNPPSTSHLGSAPDLDSVGHAPNGDIGAVGNVCGEAPADNNPLVMRWRNGAWDFVDKIRFGKADVYPFAERGGAAFDVECFAENDVWVVGYAAGRGTEATMVPMSAHWDGTKWTEVEVPWYGGRYNLIESVSGSGPNDIWAVGNYRNVAQNYHAFMVHWDGSRWSKVPLPIEGIAGDTLWDVEAIAPDDAWAVGSIDAGGVMMHWDGTEWSLFNDPSQMPRSFGYLAQMKANDVWAVAQDNSFWHFDGVTWSRQSNPPVKGAVSWWRSGGLAASGSDDLWSIGGWTDGTKNHDLAERFRVLRQVGPGIKK